ncbi:MAG: hAT transposon family protein [Candidatus Saccharimonadales bacterium]
MKDQCVSITTDAATLTNGHPYITVTGHYITEHWQLRDVVLAIQAAPGPHDGDHIRELLEAIQERWLLSGRVFAVVTDNGANFVKAARIMERCEEKLRCCVHTLQLSIKDMAEAEKSTHLPWLASLVVRSRKLVSKIKNSSSLSQMLRELQQTVQSELQELDDNDSDPSDTQSSPSSSKTSHAYSLVKDVATRFNTMCLVFSRLLKLKPELARLCEAVDDLDSLKLTEDEWNLMTSTNKVLASIKSICDILEGSKYPTISLLLPLLDTLCCVLNGGMKDILDVSTLPTEVQHLCSTLYANINTRSCLLAPEWVIASVMLDLRLRNKLIVSEQLKKHSELALRSLYNTFDAKRLFNVDTDAVVAHSQQEEQQPAQRRHRSIQDLLHAEVKAVDIVSRTETDRFLGIEKGIGFDENPLEWWRQNKEEFPKLAQMARVYLSVPASTAASERVFSYGNITIQQRRHSLQIDRVARLMWMMKNMSLYRQLSETGDM